MAHPSDYLRYAEDCVELANGTQNSEHRIMLLHIAETWRRLADSSADALVIDVVPTKAN
jgi:hypothetical protein